MIDILPGKPVYMYSMGGLAEYCVVPANALAVLPSSLPYTESAILGCAVFTAYGALRHAAEMRSGDSVAVIGVGGVGSRLADMRIFSVCLCLKERAKIFISQ
jgi:D-arabinose 1-dehydrogenase-like Zn-dependent alcohol dehydrogenase